MSLDATPSDTQPRLYSEAAFWLNRQGEFTVLNEAFTHLTGYTTEALRGQAFTGLLSPAERTSAEAWLEKAQQGTALTLEVDWPGPGSRAHAVLLTSFPVLGHAHELTGIGVQARPAPTTSPAALALKEPEQSQLAVIFQSVSDVLFVLDVAPRQQYRFLVVNQAFQKATGLPVAQVVGRLVQEIIPEPSLSVVLRYYHQAITTRQRVTWQETTEYPTGRRIGEVSVTPVFDEAGVCNQLVGNVHDLTAQKKIEEDLRDSNERFMYVLKATTDAIYDWNVTANTLLWGEGFEALFGHHLVRNPTEFRQWSDFVHPDDVAHSVHDLLRIVHETRRTHWQQEYRFQRANGSWANVFDRGHIIRDAAGQAVRMIGSMQDITERKEAEEKQRQMAQELSEQNSDLQQFGYIVSHNLRAPLANARGFANLLTHERKSSAAFDTSLRHLQTSLHQLDTIIADVNTILSIRSKARISRSEPVHLAAVCEQVRQALSQALLDCGGSITCAISDELRLPGNRAYFHSIFYNLLANSIKYRSEQRPLRIEVAATRTPGQGTQVTVTDNGLGFDLEKAGNSVFELYKRFHTTSEGRGIGLFLVKAHVEAMGGYVKVDSRVEEGTCFTLSFG
ncbi:PAS domain-containing sensor histidine kinase [Hymenobacter sp. BRD67]|uniref:PAS domain-containing sensor histidine kinase n=1 Tax=Hymenobacter sp. BRD67 TaxID=2675877 RepID=UPI0015676190|nr:PAS domain-containing sensor histidine kinase [Hymenobacter sp. BRD67]QKG54281.1 PAS domain-containing sensor histidine kinase [Hymenobacter sp. BRD67]